MEVRLLGPFELRTSGQPVELGDLQQRYILAVLVLHANRAISAERLTDIVWNGVEKPKTNLVPGYIARLRKILERGEQTDRPVIDRVATGYVLRIAPERIDLERFLALRDRAHDCADRARRLALLREAAELWRGRYLEDLDHDRVGSTGLFSPEEAYIDVLGDLAELELGEGNHRWVRDRLQSLVSAEPTRHRLAGLLMRALVANGDRVQAVNVYHDTRAALNDYGMDVPVELRRLAKFAQLSGRRVLLPSRPPRFGGRGRELARIESRLLVAAAAHRSATLWISGMPGIGKTALAVQAAYLLRERFPDGQVLVQLDGFTPEVAPVTTEDALAGLLTALGVPPEQHPPTISQRIASYQAALAGTRTLVVLDNAAGEEQTQQLLPIEPGCAALVTSRRTGGLDIADEIQLGPLQPEAAIELFHGLVGADRVRGESALVDSLVVRCGYVPLPIKMLAAQLRLHGSWSLSELTALLDESGPWRDAPGLTGRAAGACAVSYGQLDELEQLLFRLFGRLPGHDLSVPAAAALVGTTPARARELLEGLLRASLLEEPAHGRYRILDPLKEYARGLHTHADTDTERLGPLLDFYLVTTSNAIRAAYPFDQDRQPAVRRECPSAVEFGDNQAALTWLSGERLNLLAVIRYAARQDFSEHTWQLAVLLWRYYYAGGLIEDWSETLELARKALETDEAGRAGLAYVLLRLAGAHRTAGRASQSLELATEALRLWTELGDDLGQAGALCAIATVDSDRGDNASAITHYESALTKYERVEDLRGQAYALSNAGQLHELQGDLEFAEARLVAATDLLRRLSHTQGLAHTLDNLGVVRRRLGRHAQALANHEEARALAKEVGDRSCEAYALNNIGVVHRLEQRLEDAVQHHELARAVADTVAEPGLRAQLYMDRAATQLERGDRRQALTTYLAALDLARGTGDRGKQAHAHRGAAQVLHQTGEHVSAAVHWHAALEAFDGLGWTEAEDVRAELARHRCRCRAEG
ncbi:tetratricopeptide repeat protein [Amycolatopsis sp. WQ 127309]|uniref:AfsR/SARP family transcriptional regulator n=1 Tax=Amycolatopsis sp. WQ 127309 TaxID=2932773 RepID=UPI001FF1238D|nr:tetratricopeptide repeat protein [Amycolatopsis sp. WQ 127309]UOZ11343.1 tetratricopeptide repeat protein [Amycolatopsis sp. WQ 127309]